MFLRMRSLRLAEVFFFVQSQEFVYFDCAKGFSIDLTPVFVGWYLCSKIVHLPTWRIFALRCEGVYGPAAGLFSTPELLIRSCFEDMLK